MSAITTDITICNTALIMVGADEITAFTDVNREAKLCNQIYETTLRNTLQKNPWRFSLEIRQLSQLAVDPDGIDEFGFQNAYEIPAESLRIIRTNVPADDYIIVGNRLLSDQDEVWVEMQVRPDTGKFPSYFRHAIEMEMAAKLAIALTDDAGKYQLMRQAADRELAIAKNIDGQEQPVLGPSGNVFTFTSVRT